MKKLLACSMILTLLTSLGSVCFANPINLDLKGRSTLDEVFVLDQFAFVSRYNLSLLFYNKAVEFKNLVLERRYAEAADVIDDSIIGEEAIDRIMCCQFGQPNYRVIDLRAGIPEIVELANKAKESVSETNVYEHAAMFLRTAKKLKDEYACHYRCYTRSMSHNAKVHKSFVEKSLQLGDEFQKILDLRFSDDIDSEQLLTLSTALLENANEFVYTCEHSHINNGDLEPSMREFRLGVVASKSFLEYCKNFHEEIEYELNEFGEIDPESLESLCSDLEKGFKKLSYKCQDCIDCFV